MVRVMPQAKLDMEVAPAQSGESGDPGHAVVMDKLLSQMADKLIEQQRTPSRYRAPSYGQGPVAHQLDRSSDSSTDSFWESQEAKALVDQVRGPVMAAWRRCASNAHSCQCPRHSNDSNAGAYARI